MPAEYIFIGVYIDARIKINSASELNQKGVREINIEQLKDHYPNANFLHMNWGIPGKMPIWEGMSFSITEQPIQIAIPRYGLTKYFIKWELQSPKMTLKNGVYVLETREHGNYITIDKLY